MMVQLACYPVAVVNCMLWRATGKKSILVRDLLVVKHSATVGILQ